MRPTICGFYIAQSFFAPTSSVTAELAFVPYFPITRVLYNITRHTLDDRGAEPHSVAPNTLCNCSLTLIMLNYSDFPDRNA